jgi:hypothetical protein
MAGTSIPQQDNLMPVILLSILNFRKFSIMELPTHI